MRNHSHVRHAMIACLALTAAYPSAFADASWKLYDLRDLLSALPHATDQAPDAETPPMENLDEAMQPKQPAPPTPRAAMHDNVDQLLGEICGGMGLGCTRLVAGVYGVEAEEADHVTLQTMLEAVRDLYRERYAVDIVVFRSPAEKAPAIGAELQAPEPLYRQKLVVSRRTPTRVASLTRRMFVSGLNPVIATSAVAYAPEKNSADEGLDMSIVVGTNGDAEGLTTIELSGELRHVSWPAEEGAKAAAQSYPVPLNFPAVTTRSVQSYLHVAFGPLITLAVTAGFREGECLVVAASVRKL